MWRKQTEFQPSSPPDKPISQTPVASPGYTPERAAVPVAMAPSAISNATRLTQGISLKGELSGKADLYIDGEMEGNVHLSGCSVTVGPNGRVTAEIEAREIVVNGAVHGNLNGKERVLLGRSSRVNGNIETERVVIEEGARFRGKVNMVEVEHSRNSGPALQSADTPSLSPVPVHSREEFQ
jgi:cytoskeletal protein CcmA (bactofilin family)